MKNKTAIIVGASSGIGKGLANVLVENGYHVGLIARRTEMLKDIQQKLGKDKADILTLDITRQNAENEFESFLKKYEKIDL